jgi:hypothetical protein
MLSAHRRQTDIENIAVNDSVFGQGAAQIHCGGPIRLGHKPVVALGQEAMICQLLEQIAQNDVILRGNGLLSATMVNDNVNISHCNSSS